MKIHTLAAIMALTSIMTGPAVAQQSPQVASAAVDDLIICTLVYGRVSELYAEQDKPEKSASFQGTSIAYGTVADSIIASTYSENIAEGYLDERMTVVMNSLNQTAQTNNQSDLDIIEDWLDYCDGMGPKVQATLDAIALANEG